MNTLGGNVCIRNGESLDYCWKEAVNSLLPICDQVVISDCQSTDGTYELILDWAKRDGRIVVHRYPWTDPKGTNQWWPEWLNSAREQLKTDWHIQLDADEVLHENSYKLVQFAARNGKTLICQRFNFWRDTHSLIPEGVCCGSSVIRVGPQNLFMPSDYPDPRAAQISALAEPSGVQIMHYGFLRKREAFFKKARTVQRIWANDYDPRLAKAETYEGEWATMPGITGWEDKLIAFNGTHPEAAKNWLRERGYDV